MARGRNVSYQAAGFLTHTHRDDGAGDACANVGLRCSQQVAQQLRSDILWPQAACTAMFAVISVEQYDFSLAICSTDQSACQMCDMRVLRKGYRPIRTCWCVAALQQREPLWIAFHAVR